MYPAQDCGPACACRDASICASTAWCDAPRATGARCTRDAEAAELCGAMAAAAATSSAVPRIRHRRSPLAVIRGGPLGA